VGSGPAKLIGALAFGIGLVFLVIGRSELFTENFFGPVAAAIDRRQGSAWVRLVRLWANHPAPESHWRGRYDCCFYGSWNTAFGRARNLVKVAEEING
jgi:Formate/nitrite transporter